METTLSQRLSAGFRDRRTVLILLSALYLALASLATVLGLGYYLGWKEGRAITGTHRRLPAAETRKVGEENVLLTRKLAAMAPKGLHLVIDTGRNLLFVRKGDQILRQVVVSTGSGVILQDPAAGRKWVFDTPRGEYTVRSKATNPTWIKPDWAFIEEGEPIPTSYSQRMEQGVLGDYALGFGNGYFLHGTLYTRMLGRNVTHGCVRIGDDDLEYIFKNVPVGTRLFIF
jgi:L,D-transpeptidase YbiS